MNLEQVKFAIDYLVDSAIMFQLTCDGHGSFTLDVQYEPIAMQLQQELNLQAAPKSWPIVDLAKGEVLVRLH